jgi:hypothetical protein
MTAPDPTLCRWPVLPAPYAAALREVVSFAVERFQPVGIVAAGSVVRGHGDATSDLDVFVIHEQPFKQRLQRLFCGVPAEIFVNPESAVRAYFAEEHRRGRPSTAHMLATGFPVVGGPALAALRAEAAEWLAKPSTLTPEEDTGARYAAATALEDAEDVAGRDPQVSAALLGEAALAMIRHLLHAERGRIPRNKDLLRELDAHDPGAGALARRVFGGGGLAEKLESARALADRCVRARGFFAWESARVPVPEGREG